MSDEKPWTPTYDPMDDIGWLMMDQRAKKGDKQMEGNPTPNSKLRAEIGKYRTGDVILLLEGWKEEEIEVTCPATIDGPIETYKKVFKTPITRKVIFLEFDWEKERVKYQTEAGDSVGTVEASLVWKKVGHQIGVDPDEDIHAQGDGGDESPEGAVDILYPNVVGNEYIGTKGSWNKFAFRVISQQGERLRVVVTDGPIKKQIGMEFGMRRSTFEDCKLTKERTK